jgi:AcrR family transcriptional regulator
VAPPTLAQPAVGRRRSTRPADEIREAVLDAAQECFRRYGLAQTTIDDVVRASKVSRPTVYRHLGGKEDLIAAVALRELDRFLAQLSRSARRSTKIADMLVDGTLAAAKQARSNELLALMLAPDSQAIARQISDRLGPQVRDRLADYVRPLYDAARDAGVLREGLTLHDAVEWLSRIISSLTFVREPWPRTDSERRAFLHRVLVPAFIQDS